VVIRDYRKGRPNPRPVSRPRTPPLRRDLLILEGGRPCRAEFHCERGSAAQSTRWSATTWAHRW
jgi:hypothetical protein